MKIISTDLAPKAIGTYSQANENHVKNAIKNLLENKKSWSETPWEKRCDIFLKAAELLSGPYRQKMNAATMINQSKNIFQERAFRSYFIVL